MTFSVAGRDPRTGDIGVAVASKFLAVVALVPFVKSGVAAHFTGTGHGHRAAAIRAGGPSGAQRDLDRRGRPRLSGELGQPGRGDSGQPAGRATGGRRYARGLGSRGHAAPPPPPAVCPAGRRRGRRRPSRAAVGGPGVRRAGAGVRGPDRRLGEPACRRPRRSLRGTGAAAETARLCCLGARRRAGRWRRRSWAGCAPC